MLIRASIGTLALLGITSLKMIDKPTTAYLLQYSENGCEAECLFCPQSKINIKANKELVSRIPWPPIELEKFIEAYKKNEGIFSRICIENVIKEGFYEEIIEIVKRVRENNIKTPISVAITPVSKDKLVRLREEGVNDLGIGLDASTPEVFIKMRKPYTWSKYMEFIDEGIKVFGEKRVHVHLIRGLGETEEEFIKTMNNLVKKGVNISLFAFTPVKGTLMDKLKPPDICSYRRVQLVRLLLLQGYNLEEIAYFKEGRMFFRRDFLEELLDNIDKYYPAFLTSGCPGCNRPFYNERPRGPYYNYPSYRMLKEYEEVLKREIISCIVER